MSNTKKSVLEPLTIQELENVKPLTSEEIEKLLEEGYKEAQEVAKTLYHVTLPKGFFK